MELRLTISLHDTVGEFIDDKFHLVVLKRKEDRDHILAVIRDVGFEVVEDIVVRPPRS